MYEELQPPFFIFISEASSVSRSKGAKCNIFTSVNRKFWDVMVQCNYWKEYLAEILQCANFGRLVLLADCFTELHWRRKKPNILYFQNKQPKAFLNFGGSKRNAVGTITSSKRHICQEVWGICLEFCQYFIAIILRQSAVYKCST